MGLKAYYPVALELFGKLHQRTTLLFLQRFPTPQAAQAASVDVLTKAANAIWTTLHQPHLEADAVTTRTKARLMLALVRQLRPVVEEIAAYDQEISRLFLRHPDSGLFAHAMRNEVDR